MNLRTAVLLLTLIIYANAKRPTELKVLFTPECFNGNPFDGRMSLVEHNVFYHDFIIWKEVKCGLRGCHMFVKVKYNDIGKWMEPFLYMWTTCQGTDDEPYVGHCIWLDEVRDDGKKHTLVIGNFTLGDGTRCNPFPFFTVDMDYDYDNILPPKD